MEKNQKIIAVAVVVIVIIAAVAAVVLSGALDDDGSGGESNVDSQLLVYGNANEDYTIDAQDVSIIEDIIAENATLSEYPMADANCDGEVNQSDLDIVNSIVAGESTDMWVRCIGTDDQPTSVRISYPLQNLVIQGTNNASLICEIGATDLCAGYFYIYENAHGGLIEAGAEDLGGSARKVSEAAWQNFMNLDSRVGVGAIIADAGSSALADYYDAIAAAQIPLLRFSASDTFDSIAAALTIGFICGEESEAAAYSYATKCWDAFDYISERVGGLSQDERKVFLSITMGQYIAETESDYTHKAEYAGGLNIGDVNSEFASIYSGDGSEKMSSTEALSNFDGDLDYIFSFRTVDYFTDTATFVSEEWDEYWPFYQNLDCHENFVIINGMLPQICQTAYAAAVMYPDLVSMEWADSLLESFIEDSSSMSGYTMDDIITVFTYQDYAEYMASA